MDTKKENTKTFLLSILYRMFHFAVMITLLSWYFYCLLKVFYIFKNAQTIIAQINSVENYLHKLPLTNRQ